MELARLTDRIWYYPHEEARDRPNLSYIRGDRWSLAVDAGHSGAHTAEFYQALEAAGLPLPALTVLTHWHWDHTFGMHAVHGLTLAHTRTNVHLADFRARLEREGREMFLGLHESVAREYADGRPVVIRTADITYRNELLLDPGGCPVRILHAASPHTDDATLLYAERGGVLFLGDALSGTFPNWEKDPAVCRTLAETIEAIDPAVCFESHWTPTTKEDALEELFGEG